MGAQSKYCKRVLRFSADSQCLTDLKPRFYSLMITGHMFTLFPIRIHSSWYYYLVYKLREKLVKALVTLLVEGGK